MEPCRWSGRVPCSATIDRETKRNWFQPATRPLPLSSSACDGGMAVVHGEAVLRQRFCLGQGCQSVFFIRTHCDRGHRYCSTECRDHARRRQRRAANGRHQRSPEGRLDHRDRQQAYRCRQRPAQPRVTDQGSISTVSPASFDCGRADAVEHPAAPPSRQESQPALWLRCRVCGRAGRFIDPFPRIPHRRRAIS